MAKFGKLAIVLLCIFLTGCKKPDLQTDNRFVTKVTVELTRQGKVRKWSFTQPQKMEVVLYYLRNLDSLGPASSDPERFGGDCYRIDLCYTDGETCRIYQRDQFISKALGPWKTVDSTKASLLYPLLANLSSD